MQGIFQCLLILWALICLLLLAPVTVSVKLGVTPRGGHGVLAIGFLMAKLSIPLRLHLLEEPYLTLEGYAGKTAISVPLQKRKKKGGSPWGKALLHAMRLENAGACWTVGIPGRADLSALACAGLCGLTEGILPTWCAAYFYGGACRLNLEGMATARIAEIIRVRMAERGE